MVHDGRNEALARRGRPALALAGRKVATNVRQGPDVLDACKATGESWRPAY
ncbi:BrnA antitoxin family protein [Cupriavidus basilensis]|uniref:BrnA antitoxin family protein n=1 Tax=Cupriavidus basilensis TaxID=68895 RepID=UPI003204620A